MIYDKGFHFSCLVADSYYIRPKHYKKLAILTIQVYSYWVNRRRKRPVPINKFDQTSTSCEVPADNKYCQYHRR